MVGKCGRLHDAACSDPYCGGCHECCYVPPAGEVVASTGKELYYLALAKAREWNHGRDPEASIRETFLFNVLNYPESFGLKIAVTVEKVPRPKPIDEHAD